MKNSRESVKNKCPETAWREEILREIKKKPRIWASREEKTLSCEDGVTRERA